jgi:sortase B
MSTASFNILTILDWNKDNKDTSKAIEEIDNTNIEELEDDENTENINEPEDLNSDYWYYITFPLINVDFNELLKKNDDTIAWINVNNTNINYPVVQSTDNDYYLSHSYDKSQNEAGWVFLDYRNNKDLSSKNNIIYAHSRLDKTMFGSLSKVLKESWYTDKSNHIIRISTPTENTLWQIFSVYVIEEETYYITTNFKNDDDYLTFLNTIKKRSKYDFNTTLTTSDRILTLSTCYSDTERTVVHAKLIKRSTR